MIPVHFLQPAHSTASMTAEESAIARSVLFASLFDYPLTLAQLRQTLIESAQTPSEIQAAYTRSDALRATIEHRQGFFFPRDRRDLIGERRRREARSKIFLDRHRRLLSVICALPYVEMVALSGSIAHLNLEGSGDLDLFIVTRGRHVWSVTVAVVVIAKLMRRRKTTCANFVLADSTLSLDQQDLFSASQIIHLKPLVGEDMYRRFVAANPFVSRFYPNFRVAPKAGRRSGWNQVVGGVKKLVETALAAPSMLVEPLCRRAYRWYLTRRSSTWDSPEQVRLETDCLKLHTKSHRRSVLARFDNALHNLDG
jgi:hypothetical protein